MPVNRFFNLVLASQNQTQTSRTKNTRVPKNPIHANQKKKKTLTCNDIPARDEKSRGRRRRTPIPAPPRPSPCAPPAAAGVRRAPRQATVARPAESRRRKARAGQGGMGEGRHRCRAPRLALPAAAAAAGSAGR